MTTTLSSPAAPTQPAVVPADERPPVADELIAAAVADRPGLAALPIAEQTLAAAWLASLRSARTRRVVDGDP